VDYHEIASAEVDAPARTCIIDIECEDERVFPTPSATRSSASPLSIHLTRTIPRSSCRGGLPGEIAQKEQDGA